MASTWLDQWGVNHPYSGTLCDHCNREGLPKTAKLGEYALYYCIRPAGHSGNHVHKAVKNV